MSNVSAIVFHEHGEPAAVARLERRELPPPGPGEVRVRMLAAPINPADLNRIEGKYGVEPVSLPAFCGGEGAGVVEECGAGVESVHPGETVIFPQQSGTWSEAVNVPATDGRGVFPLVVVPRDIPPEHAAMLRVNPATALRMLRDFERLEPGDWFVQNAANSAVGRAAIELARHLGLRSVNVVRRAELGGDLRALGADTVLIEDDSVPEQIASVTGGHTPKLALNAVGGESAMRLARALAPGGTLVTYGAMSRQSLRVPAGILIFRDIVFRGFWVSRWYQGADGAAIRAMLAEVIDLAARGCFRPPIERVYPLAEHAAALADAQRSGRGGKILFAAPEVLTRYRCS